MRHPLGVFSVFSQPAGGGGPNGFTGGKAFGYIQNPLVFAAPEGGLQAPLSQNERAVDQHIQLAQKGLLGGCTVEELLKGVAGVGGYLVAFFF